MPHDLRIRVLDSNLQHAKTHLAVAHTTITTLSHALGPALSRVYIVIEDSQYERNQRHKPEDPHDGDETPQD